MPHTITRGQQAGSHATPHPYPVCWAPAHPCSPGTSKAQAPWNAGSMAVLTISVCAGTKGQVGAQHHGRDQVLEGWNLNQWQPGEGNNKGTLGRKAGTGLLEE